jgi:hypothetical protein
MEYFNIKMENAFRINFQLIIHHGLDMQYAGYIEIGDSAD